MSGSNDDTDERPTRVGHVHLKVRDVERAAWFYSEVLGMEITERYHRFVFLSFGDGHHDIALQEVSPGAPGPGPGVGLYHAAFEVETAAELAAIFERLQERGIPVSPVDHGISKALYFDDQDGNGLKVYLDTREEDDQYKWEGINERFDPVEFANADDSSDHDSVEASAE